MMKNDDKSNSTSARFKKTFKHFSILFVCVWCHTVKSVVYCEVWRNEKRNVTARMGFLLRTHTHTIIYFYFCCCHSYRLKNSRTFLFCFVFLLNNYRRNKQHKTIKTIDVDIDPLFFSLSNFLFFKFLLGNFRFSFVLLLYFYFFIFYF